MQAKTVKSRPMKNDSAVSRAFADRLVARMKERGHASPTSRSGVDVAALAAAVGISYEMARRYVEGLAVPRPDKLARIADWVGVTSAWLLWGESHRAEGADAINQKVLEECLIAATAAQQATGIQLSAEKLAHVISLLYAEATEGRPMNQASLVRLLRVL